MLIKVCGLIQQKNIHALSRCSVDMMGLNFYALSDRFLKIEQVRIPKDILKVGVFVNAPIEDILEKTVKYALDFVQLHGDETPEFCIDLQRYVKVIKVFRIDNFFDWRILEKFYCCNMFLFDTQSPQYGGSGKKFDWTILNSKDIPVPWLLSGGIDEDDVGNILKIDSIKFVGVDINSRFETSVGIKDVEKVSTFCKKLKNK